MKQTKNKQLYGKVEVDDTSLIGMSMHNVTDVTMVRKDIPTSNGVLKIIYINSINDVGVKTTVTYFLTPNPYAVKGKGGAE